jgi:hypothetical protein
VEKKKRGWILVKESRIVELKVFNIIIETIFYFCILGKKIKEQCSCCLFRKVCLGKRRACYLNM